MPRFATLLAWIAVIALEGCNQQVAILETPVSPSPTAAPIPVPAQPQVAGISISPGGVDGGDGATGLITLEGVAQVFPVTVSLSSNNEVAIVPSEATVPAGSNIGRFGVKTQRFPNDRTVVISAATPNRTVTTNFEVWAINAPMYFKYLSDENNFLGGGVGRFVPGPATFSAVCDRNEVRIQVRVTGPQGPELWTARFKGPNDEPLREGDAFPYATRLGLTVDGPGMDISGRGRECNNNAGRFFVEEIDLRNHRVNLFRATFDQYCYDGKEGSVYGEVRVEHMPASSSIVECFR